VHHPRAGGWSRPDARTPSLGAGGVHSHPCCPATSTSTSRSAPAAAPTAIFAIAVARQRAGRRDTCARLRVRAHVRSSAPGRRRSARRQHALPAAALRRASGRSGRTHHEALRAWYELAPERRGDWRSRRIPTTVSRNAVDPWRAAGVNRLTRVPDVPTREPSPWMHRTGHESAQVLGARGRETARAAGLRRPSRSTSSSRSRTPCRATGRPTWRVRSRSADAPVAVRADRRARHAARALGRARAGRGGRRGPLRARVPARPRGARRRRVEHYEVSNFARPAAGRGTTRVLVGRTLPRAGPSAHGFDGEERRWNAPAYAGWVRDGDRRV
jgi:hypothetical protein